LAAGISDAVRNPAQVRNKQAVRPSSLTKNLENGGALEIHATRGRADSGGFSGSRLMKAGKRSRMLLREVLKK
jgi:hypothetical protein